MYETTIGKVILNKKNKAEDIILSDYRLYTNEQ